MPDHPGWALQKAVYALLAADTELLTLLGGANVFDHVPRNAAAPYVRIGTVSSADWSTMTEAGAEVTFQIVVWSSGHGQSEALAIAERVVAILHDAAPALTGHALINFRHRRTEIAPVPPELSFRARLTFRAVLEPAP